MGHVYNELVLYSGENTKVLQKLKNKYNNN